MFSQNRVLEWLYKASHFAFILFFVGFSAVMPIDVIAQASHSTNDALNTFIVVGAVVIFALVCIIIALGRMFIQRSCMQDIPRRYIPLAAEDLPHIGSRRLILANIERSKELSVLFRKPKGRVIHDGLSPPVEKDDIDALPEYLNYDNCIKAIADRLKYQGLFMNSVSFDIHLNSTFADVVRSQFVNSPANEHSKDAEEYVALYETIRYSGKEISQEQFVRFMELCILFFDLSLIMDKNLEMNSPRRPSAIGSSSSLNTISRDRNHLTVSRTYDYPEVDSAGTSEYAQNIHSNAGSQPLGYPYDDYSNNYSPEEYCMRRTNTNSTVARRVSSSALGEGYDLDETEEPPETVLDYQRYRNMLSKVESYKSVIRR